MKALVKSRAACGLWLADVPEPEPGINDVKIRVLLHRHLRHRLAHLRLERMGAVHNSRAAGDWPRVFRRDC